MTLLPTPLEAFQIASLNEHKGVWFPPHVQEHSLEKLQTFEVRESDIILATYPKCGTHWMMEVLHLMKHNGYVDKIERWKSKELMGCIEFAHPPSKKNLLREFMSVIFLVIFCLLKFGPKNRRYKFLNTSSNDPACQIPWNDFFDRFVSKKAWFGNWFDHILGFWNHRDDGHVFFITFEEMKKDLRSVIRRLEAFLELTITPQGMERILDHASLEGMKKTYAKIEEEHKFGVFLTRGFGVMPFLQKGIVGGWKTKFTVAQNELMDKMLEERLKGTGLEAHYK